MSSDQYQHPKWQRKRLKVMKRAGFRCERPDCDSPKDTSLHVHHTFYEEGRKIWQYPKSSLECLCKFCHEKEHGIESSEEGGHGLYGITIDEDYGGVNPICNCSNLKSLSEKQAERIVWRMRDWDAAHLHLSELTELSGKAAEHLAGKKWQSIELNSLDELSATAAGWLAQSVVEGVEEEEDEEGWYDPEPQGLIELHGITEMSPVAAAALRDTDCRYRLELGRVHDDAAYELCRGDFLSLSLEIVKPSVETLDCLDSNAWKRIDLYVNFSDSGCSEKVAQALSRAHISSVALDLYSPRRKVLSCFRHTRCDSFALSISSSVKKFHKVMKSLSELGDTQTQMTLCLDDFYCMTVEDVEKMSSFMVKDLWLDVHELTEEMAEVILENMSVYGELVLKTNGELDWDVAYLLSKHAKASELVLTMHEDQEIEDLLAEAGVRFSPCFWPPEYCSSQIWGEFALRD